jgi:hypothetical protein
MQCIAGRCFSVADRLWQIECRCGTRTRKDTVALRSAVLHALQKVPFVSLWFYFICLAWVAAHEQTRTAEVSVLQHAGRRCQQCVSVLSVALLFTVTIVACLAEVGLSGVVYRSPPVCFGIAQRRVRPADCLAV